MRFLIVILAWLGLSACSVGIDGKDYTQQTPPLSLEQFFDGKVKAWGIVQNRSGEVVQRFIVDINGVNEPNGSLTLNESFTYLLGEGVNKRVWHIRQGDTANHFIGEASDIAGPAQGRSYGNAFNFNYEMDLPVDDTEYRVSFDDWFWAMDEHTLMNRSYIRKFGIVMAEVTIFMQKQ